MQIEMKYFGMIAEQTGINSEILDFPQDFDLNKLKEQLHSKYEGLEKIHFSFAIDMELTSNLDQVISKDCEIALLPAFAGG